MKILREHKLLKQYHERGLSIFLTCKKKQTVLNIKLYETLYRTLRRHNFGDFAVSLTRSLIKYSVPGLIFRLQLNKPWLNGAHVRFMSAVQKLKVYLLQYSLIPFHLFYGVLRHPVEHRRKTFSPWKRCRRIYFTTHYVKFRNKYIAKCYITTWYF